MHRSFRPSFLSGSQIMTRLVFVLLWFCSFRVGEAKVPGPCGFGSNDCFGFDCALADDDTADTLIVGTMNPSGIAGKANLMKQFPAGWWSVTETQAADAQLRSFGHLMRRRDDDACSFSVLSGAPAPCRPGSMASGTWTGVLQFSTTPMRPVVMEWPRNVWESGRVMMAVSRFSGIDVTRATLYLPPRGPTFPQARSLAESLWNRSQLNSAVEGFASSVVI